MLFIEKDVETGKTQGYIQGFYKLFEHRSSHINTVISEAFAYPSTRSIVATSTIKGPICSMVVLWGRYYTPGGPWWGQV